MTHDAALDALETVVKAALNGAETFVRNPEKSVDASEEGVVIMTDGDPGEPEVILSPLSFSFDRQVEFEITAKGETRKAVVSALVAKFDPALAVDRTLGGAVEDARIVSAPEVTEYDTDGAATERSAVLRVQLSYTLIDSAA